MPIFNPLTGKKRRRRTCETSQVIRKVQALDAKDVMILKALHKRIENMIELLSSCIYSTSVCMITWTLNLVDPHAASLLTLSWMALVFELMLNIINYFDLDSQIADIDPEDEFPKGHACRPRRHPNLENYGSSVDICNDTNFRPKEIRTIMEFLQIPDVYRIDVEPEGGKSYIFEKEEVMLFLLRKIKTGHEIVELVKSDKFGGDARKWSLLKNKFLQDIEPLIEDHINFRLLQRYRDQFPLFTSVIADRMAQGFEWQNPETRVYEHVHGK